MKNRGEPTARKPGTRSRNKRVIIYCEGSKTEPTYFKLIKNRYRISGLDIKIPKTSETNPLRLVDAAIQGIKKDDDLDLKDEDQVWCVYDVDEITDKALNEAYTKADKAKIRIALSNPAFELWYLLHYEYTTSTMSDCDKVIERLKKHIPEYEKTSKKILDILESSSSASRQNAIENAKSLNKYHKELGRTLCGTDCNPSTQVFELVEYIFTYVK